MRASTFSLVDAASLSQLAPATASADTPQPADPQPPAGALCKTWFVVKSALLLGKQGRIIQGASSFQGIRDQRVTQRKKAGWFGSHLGNACPGFFLPWPVSWEGVPPGPEAGARRDQENTHGQTSETPRAGFQTTQ